MTSITVGHHEIFNLLFDGQNSSKQMATKDGTNELLKQFNYLFGGLQYEFVVKTLIRHRA